MYGTSENTSEQEKDDEEIIYLVGQGALIMQMQKSIREAWKEKIITREQKIVLQTFLENMNFQK